MKNSAILILIAIFIVASACQKKTPNQTSPDKNHHYCECTVVNPNGGKTTTEALFDASQTTKSEAKKKCTDLQNKLIESRLDAKCKLK